jgi:hypothetical protein
MLIKRFCHFLTDNCCFGQGHILGRLDEVSARSIWPCSVMCAMSKYMLTHYTILTALLFKCIQIQRFFERTSGAVVARPTPMRKVRGSSPVRDKNFRVRMRRSNYLGLVSLTSFGWDDKPRSSVCTHSEHQARTIKILQSLCASHKIVETYRNQHAQCLLSEPCQ